MNDHNNSASEASDSDLANEPNSLKQFLKVLGPGLITGASDYNPSGIATYFMAGASLHFLHGRAANRTCKSFAQTG
jgi:hypothetical protein